MTRRILITLGSTTDAERCGDCDRKDGALCMLFGEVLAMARAPIPPPTRGFKLVATRLPECIAAEKAAETLPFRWRCQGCHLTMQSDHDSGVVVPLLCPKCEEARRG